MERCMKPERLGIDPNSPDADKTYKHWYKTFCNFIDSFSMARENTEESSTGTQVNKFNLLINYIESSVYEYISKCGSYEEAIETLESVDVKPNNVILARHILSTRKQKLGEILDKYLNELKTLAEDCAIQVRNDT